QHAGPPLLGELDAAKLWSGHSFDPVMARQPFVEKRVAPVEELINAAVRAYDRSEEQLGLLPQVQPHRVVETGKLGGIRLDVFRRQPSQAEPLAGKARHERIRTRIVQE